MFSHDSRYAALPDRVFVGEDGREYVYKARRLPPQASSMRIGAHVAPRPGERMDQFAARTLGDPLRYWVIADANDRLDPQDAVDAGAPLAIPEPGQGR